MSITPCIILTPVASSIDPRCEAALHALEQRGYLVRRVQGHSAIDFGRSVMASEALRDGFEELMWIDSDVAFRPEDVERLRALQVPISCGIYPKKSKPEFACEFLPGAKQIVFGKEGGVHEIRYAGFGFVRTRREVYEAMRSKFDLGDCNQRFGKPVTPYFLPIVVPDGAGRRYLSEDYAFCERARQCGFKILADTTICLRHMGTYGYTWEDVGRMQGKKSLSDPNLSNDFRELNIDLNPSDEKADS